MRVPDCLGPGLKRLVEQKPGAQCSQASIELAQMPPSQHTHRPPAAAQGMHCALFYVAKRGPSWVSVNL
jgi:hypothetical protein